MPFRELERLKVVKRFLTLETGQEKDMQAIVDLAAKVCGTKSAFITLIDEKVQHIVVSKNFNIDFISKQDELFNPFFSDEILSIIPDTLADARLNNHPFVFTEPFIRFVAGSSLITSDGYHLGSLYVTGQEPIELTDLQIEQLISFGSQVVKLLELDNSMELLRQQFIEASRKEIELRSFFESSIDSHLLLGRRFEVLAFNKVFEDLIHLQYGLRPKCGDVMSSILDPGINAAIFANYEGALNGKPFTEQRVVSYRGKNRWWYIKYEPAFDGDQRIIGVSINSSDITDNVLKQERVFLQNQSLEQIAFIQSHELRRPVANILGLLEILKLEYESRGIQELQLLESVVKELDEKVKLVVQYVDKGRIRPDTD